MPLLLEEVSCGGVVHVLGWWRGGSYRLSAGKVGGGGGHGGSADGLQEVMEGQCTWVGWEGSSWRGCAVSRWAVWEGAWTGSAIRLE